MLKIKKIIESMSYGKSSPIKVLADDGKVYVLKFRKDNLPGKDKSITNEYIAYKLIEQLHFNIAPQKLKLIEIDDIAMELLDGANISIASRGYFLASKGTNIAIEFIDSCEKALHDEIDNMSFIEQVKTIDNLILNDDRCIDNTNILVNTTVKRVYIAIDWGLSFENADLYKEVRKGELGGGRLMYYHTASAVNRPGYIFKARGSYRTPELKNIDDIIREIVYSIPEEWETCISKDSLINIITMRIANKKLFTNERK